MKRNPIARDVRSPKYSQRIERKRKGKGSFKRDNRDGKRQGFPNGTPKAIFTLIRENRIFLQRMGIETGVPEDKWDNR